MSDLAASAMARAETAIEIDGEEGALLADSGSPLICSFIFSCYPETYLDGTCLSWHAGNLTRALLLLVPTYFSASGVRGRQRRSLEHKIWRRGAVV